MENSIYFLDKAIKANFIPGDTIADVARQYDIDIDQPCAGRGSCGKCKVLIEGALEQPTDKERTLLQKGDLLRGIRLACQTKAVPGMSVKVICDVPKQMQILTTTKLSIGRGSVPKNTFASSAIAIDIGTTTLVAYLVDLNNAVIVDTVSAMNPQVVFGADVISRISYAAEDNAHVLEMQRCLILELNKMILKLCCAAHKPSLLIDEIIVAGNSTMEHIFLGVSPVSIGRAPFKPVFYQAADMHASDIEMEIPGNPIVRLIPNICGFVGGDIVAGIIYSGMQTSEELSLLIDIGTNNEMVLGNKDSIVCCSAAAGPALEGAKISCGMRASAGAIERVWCDGEDIYVKTILGALPIGICGSGLVDAVAVLLQTGVISQTGKFANRELLSSDSLRNRLHGTKAADTLFDLFCNGDTASVCLTQKDIREFQLAKSAIMTGIEIMLKEYAKCITDIDKIYIAGAFGSYIDIANAIKVGILPEVPLEKIIPIGNSSGLGASLMAIDKTLWKESSRLIGKVQHIELAMHNEFQKIFIKNITFKTLNN